MAIEPPAPAVRAGSRAHVAGELLAHVRRLRLPVASLHVRNDAFEGPNLPVAPAIPDLDGLPAAAVEHGVPDMRREIPKGNVEVEAVVGGKRFQQAEVVGVATIPAAHRAARQTQLRAGHHPLGVEERLAAEPVARGACAGRTVEGEQARLELRKRVSAFGAGESGREDVVAADTAPVGIEAGDRRPAVGGARARSRRTRRAAQRCPDVPGTGPRPPRRSDGRFRPDGAAGRARRPGRRPAPARIRRSEATRRRPDAPPCGGAQGERGA